MSDPFRPDVNQQLMREARFGVIFIGLTVAICGYLIYQRVQTQFTIPDHVRNAPAATMQSEDEPDALLAENQKRKRQLEHRQRIEAIKRRSRDNNNSLTKSEPLFAAAPEDPSPLHHPLGATTNAPPTHRAVASNNPRVRQVTVVDDPFDTKAKTGSIPATIPSVTPKLAASTAPLNDKKQFQPTQPFGMPNPKTDLPKMVEPPKHSENVKPNREKNDFKLPPATKTSFTTLPPSNANNKNGFMPLKTQAAPTQTAPTQTAPTTLNQPPQQPTPAPDSFPTSPPAPDEPDVSTTATIEEPPKRKAAENESLWSISTEVYGDGRWFRALHAENESLLTADGQPRPGSALSTPDKTTLRNRWPELCPRDESKQISDAGHRFYVTSQGDTLFQLARQKLGQASRYLEIIQMNELRLPENVKHLTPLSADLKLVLPIQ